MFHLGWFYDGHVPTRWTSTFSRENSQDWIDPVFLADFARALERACFDFILVEDTTYVPADYQGTMDAYLKHGVAAPKLEATAVTGLMLQATSHIGVAATLSTTEWTPYQLARVVASLDHLYGGRVGWNIVTGIADRAMQNYGRPELPEHDRRYEMADEFTDLVTRLWESWDADAVVKDRERGMYVDPAKVRQLDFEGTWFSSTGPLVVPRPPQGRPFLCQAGSSSAGRDLASKWANCILGTGDSPERMKEYRDDVRARMTALGRDPDECKVLFIVEPVVGATDQEARDTAARNVDAIRQAPEEAIANLSKNRSFDFGQFDPDTPIREIAAKVVSNGAIGGLADMAAAPAETTLRDYVTRSSFHALLVGTPETIADRMAEIDEHVGGDGFLLTDYGLDRRGLAAVTDGLVPELQRRGLVRTRYAGADAKENLLAF